MQTKPKKSGASAEGRRFWFGAFICTCGVAMLFAAMLIDTTTSPKGEISGSILGAVGEVFVLGGSILGLDSYVNYKIKRILRDNDKEEE